MTVKAKRAPSKAAPARVQVESGPGFVRGNVVGLRTARGKNGSHGHWRAAHNRNQAERDAARLAAGAALGGYGAGRHAPPYVVTITRSAPSAGLDSDNLQGALAYVRDGVADALGTGDGPKSPVEWRYAQERGPWGVRIEIACAPEAKP